MWCCVWVSGSVHVVELYGNTRLLTQIHIAEDRNLEYMSVCSK